MTVCLVSVSVETVVHHVMLGSTKSQHPSLCTSETRSGGARLWYCRRILNTDADEASRQNHSFLLHWPIRYDRLQTGGRDSHSRRLIRPVQRERERERGSSWPRKPLCHLAPLLYQQFSISSMKYPTNSGLINGSCWLKALVHWCKCFLVARAWTEN